MQYEKALAALYPSLSELQKSALSALLYAPNCSSSAGQLSRLLGVAVVQVNSALGRIGRKLYESVGTHPEGLKEGMFQWWHMLATGVSTENSGFVWQLRPEAASALQHINRARSGVEEILESDLHEGTVRQITVNAYERNPVARDRCVAIHGASCVICGFNFEAEYGSMASGFVHVHHTVPLATVGGDYEVDPATDLVPLCPNCHAVVHMANPPYTIEEVKDMRVRAKERVRKGEVASRVCE